MDERSATLTSPMTAAVICDLQNCPRAPEEGYARSKPAANRVGFARHLERETPGEHTEDRQGNRNKPRMDLNYLAEQQWHPGQFILPPQNPKQEQVQHCHSELKSGCAIKNKRHLSGKRVHNEFKLSKA